MIWSGELSIYGLECDARLEAVHRTGGLQCIGVYIGLGFRSCRYGLVVLGQHYSIIYDIIGARSAIYFYEC